MVVLYYGGTLLHIYLLSILLLTNHSQLHRISKNAQQTHPHMTNLGHDIGPDCY